MNDKKLVVTVTKVHTSSRGEFDNRRRTAVFNEDSTVKEILDWARERNDVYSSHYWDDAHISISEDELSHPKERFGGFFSDLEEKSETQNS